MLISKYIYIYVTWEHLHGTNDLHQPISNSYPAPLHRWLAEGGPNARPTVMCRSSQEWCTDYSNELSRASFTYKNYPFYILFLVIISFFLLFEINTQLLAKQIGILIRSLFLLKNSHARNRTHHLLFLYKPSTIIITLYYI